LKTSSISPIQRVLIRRSFRKVARHPDLVAELLYNRLFEIAPACKMLFACDMQQQGRKFIQFLAISVVSLDTPEILIRAIQELGQRHSRYAITMADYQQVGEALRYALEQTLSEDWTPELNQAWTAFCDFIAQTAVMPIN